MVQMDSHLNIRIPEAVMDRLRRESRRRMISTSALVRMLLAEGLGMVEPPTVLVDPATEYETEAPCTP